jgi:Holliday junction resolvasome RuvABC ATP-dependent DNA helicase subunit
MTCDAYYWPMSWGCYGISAVGTGVGNFIANVATGAFSSIDKDELARKVAEVAKKFQEELSRQLGRDFGRNIADFINTHFTDFWNDVAFSEKVKRISEETLKALKEIKVADNVKVILDDISKLIGNVRGLAFEHLDGFRADIQQIFANMARDTTLKMVPWVALGTSVTVGTPYLVSYIYRRAVHDIGKPKLATDVRYVGWYDRSVDLLSNAASASYESSKVGLKFGLGAALLSAGSFVAANAFSLYKDGATLAPQQVDEFWAFMQIAVLGVAAVAAVSKASVITYKGVKSSYKKLDKPVFYKELNDTIEQITKSTYNLQKHGGFFQNVLLYGPGGTGKTMISKFMAKNSNMNYVMMSGGDLAQYIGRGEHVTELNKLFESAKRSSSPTILFIDEAESLCRNRDSIVKPELVELQNAFLNHTGESSNKIMLIMATNRIEDLDPAVLTRMDHKLFIGPPKITERKQIITNYLPNLFSAKEIKELFPEEIIGSIGLKTEGMTGRAIFKMLNAIRGSKNSSADNKLTREIISTGVKKFVEQEVRAMEAVNAKAKGPAAVVPSPVPPVEEVNTKGKTPAPVVAKETVNAKGKAPAPVVPKGKAPAPVVPTPVPVKQ